MTLQEHELQHQEASKRIILPKWTQYRIYWQPSKPDFGVAFVICGYCPDTLPYFRAMYRKAKKTFPDLREEDCTCGKVSKSSSIQGFTLLTFRVDGPKRDVPGWDPWDMNIDFSY